MTQAASSASGRRFELPPPLVLADEIARQVDTALAEDWGVPGQRRDWSAELIARDQTMTATVVAREAAILCGQAWFDRCFAVIDPEIRIHWQVHEGSAVDKAQTLCRLHGRARTLLTGERSALNFLQLLSAVATQTRRFVDAVATTSAQIVDTRKTLPGLRTAQKYAVFIGGGNNHRLALWDAMLIKENHLAALGGVSKALDYARQQLAAQPEHCCRFVQIEVETLSQLDEALASGATSILLDNLDLETMAIAVERTAGRAVLEASGNVSLDRVLAIAKTGVDRISIGALTKDIRAIDLSLRYQHA